MASETISLKPRRRATAESALWARAGDDLQKIVVGQQRRIFEDRRGHGLFRIAGERLDDGFGHAIEPLDLFGKDRAHARQLVGCQALQRFQRQLADPIAFGLQKIGQQAADIVRQLAAYLGIDVVGQETIGFRWRRRIGRHQTARSIGTMLGQIIEHLRLDIGAAGEFLLGTALMGFQHRAGILIGQRSRQTRPSKQAFEELSHWSLEGGPCFHGLFRERP